MLAITAFALCVAASLAVEFQPIPDYSFKTYRGTVPKSALRVQHADCDESTYIGLGWFKEGFLVGQLKASNTELLATATGKVLKTDKNPLILTTHHPHLFHWVKTTTEGFETLKGECELIVAGVETDTSLYVGRQTLNGEIVVGKIYKYPGGRELVLPNVRTNGETRFTSFEVLAYDCQKSCSNST